MKKQSLNTIAKKIFLGSMLSTVMFLSANAAAVTTDNNTVTSADSVATKGEIVYTGVDNNELLSFNVKFNNPSGNKFNVLVLDESGESIFRDTYADKKFTKSFKLPKTDVKQVTFLIQSGKKVVKEVFDINISTREITDVVVNRSK